MEWFFSFPLWNHKFAGWDLLKKLECAIDCPFPLPKIPVDQFGGHYHFRFMILDFWLKKEKIIGFSSLLKKKNWKWRRRVHSHWGTKKGHTLIKLRKVLALKEVAMDLDERRLFYDRKEPVIGDYFFDSLISDLESLKLYAGIHDNQFGFHRMLSKRFPSDQPEAYSQAFVLLLPLSDVHARHALVIRVVAII